jgi:hypothetical protein
VNKYVVWSQVEDQDPVIEVSRSERKVADEDAALLRWVGHRKAWVQEREEKL